ncbi:MAG: LON peptidase substrate-binding domain-containing protein [Actinomycetota bacterium]
MDLPVFALHAVLFPGQQISLHVFEERYLRMLKDLELGGSFVVVAIRKGQEVGGPAEPYRVGVRGSIAGSEQRDDGSFTLEVEGKDRVALLAPRALDPYPVWDVSGFPDEGGAGTDDVDAAVRALDRFLTASGEDGTVAVGHEPVSASFALAGAVPGLVPQRQALLEMAGAGERLRRAKEIFGREANLLRVLRSVPGGPQPEVSPN